MSRYPNWVSMCLNQHTHTQTNTATQRMRNILLHTLAGTSAVLVCHLPFAIPAFPLRISCTKLSPAQDATCLELLRWKSTQVQAENINQKPWGPKISLSMTDGTGAGETAALLCGATTRQVSS